MKKILLTAVLAATVSFAIAQETQENEVLTNRRGTPILPTAGTWALGVDATPFLNFAGNIFGASATAPSFNGATFFGKYFLRDNKALVFRVNINSWSGSTVNFVDKAGTTTGEIVENVSRSTNTFVRLHFGCERRIGSGRLQGFYGAEAVLGFGSAGNRISNTWGNDLTSNFQNGGQWRVLVDKPGVNFEIGANAFVGIEYFVAPGIALGARVGYGMSFETGGRRSQDQERWHDGRRETRTQEDFTRTNANVFRFNNFGGGITLTFHF